MVQDFDFFLLLSALAVLLVLWRMVRTFRGTGSRGKSQNTINAKTGEIKAHRARTERIKSRKPDPQIEMPKEEKKPPRVMALIFTTAQSKTFAVIQLTSVGAQAWGDETFKLSENLQSFLNRFLKPEDNESVLIHICQALSETEQLSAVAVNENGERMGEAMPVGLTVRDFPLYEEIQSKEISEWLLSALQAQYRERFMKLDPSQMAQLIKAEYMDKNFPLDLIAKERAEVTLALAFLLLTKILSYSDFAVRSALWNCYWKLLENNNFHDDETLNRFERLVISQTFVQTQKLPFLLIHPPTSSANCYKALNY